MKIKYVLSAAVAVFAFNLAAMAQSTVAISGTPTGTTRSDNYEWGAGWGFSAPAGTGTTINALGFWDATGTGLDTSHIVALYEYSGSGSSYNLLDDVTVQAGAADPLVDGYRWVSIPTLALPDNGQGGNYYIVLATQGGGDTWTSMSGQTINPAIGTFSSGALIDNNNPYGYDLSVSVPNSLTYVDGSNAGYGGGNVGFITSVPEPATFALLGGGLMLGALRLKGKR
jgi:hypothetical protein